MENETAFIRRTFPGQSELAGRMRAFEWSATALGSPQEWPEPLKHSVSLCVTSKFPIAMYWGPDRIMLYNDSYIPFLGDAKHPRSLGRPAREAWSDNWDALELLFERVQRTGEATWSADVQSFVSRTLPKQEIYVTFTLGPILSAAGAVDGFFCPCTEVTEKVIGARRLETLRKLAAGTLETRTTETACAHAATVLAQNPSDCPFAAIYLVDEADGSAGLQSVVGFAGEEHPFPGAVAAADRNDSPWPLAAALRSRRAEATPNLAEAQMRLPGGPWPEPASRAVVLPVFARPGNLSGMVVFGVGPRCVLDDAYRAFFGSIAAHIGTALSNAKAYEAEQKRADVLALRWVPASPVAHHGAAASAQAHVVFAEDNADMRQYVQHLLGDRYRVTAVADGAAALEAAQSQPPDLILADVVMPNLDGFGLLDRVRGDPRLAALPVVLLSARGGEEATADGMRAGADDYLTKPFGAQELLARIETQVRRRRAEEERQRLLVELTESRRMFQQMADASPDTIYVYDVVDGRTLFMSARAEQVIGYSADEVIERGHRFATELWHPDDAARLPEYRHRLATLADGHVLETEYRVRQPDTSYRWLRSRAAPLTRTASGQLQRFVGVTQDITDRKRADQALRASEERFRSYFELGLIGMTVTTPAKGLLEVNPEMCRILGFERDELLRRTWAELTHPDDLAADVLQFNRVMAGEIEGYSLDKRMIRKDGAIIDATISVKCVRAADGSVDYFVALLQDITERTRTNEALARARGELERRVAERTERLSQLNEGLLRLHDFSTRQLAEADVRQILNDALVTLIAMHGADFGNIQLCRRDTGGLEIVAHHGVGQEFLDYFDAVADDSFACGRTQQQQQQQQWQQQRLIIEDVQTDPRFAPHRAAAAAAGFRAVQSTPITSRSGEPLGVISTHFRQPHRPSGETLRLTDLFAMQVAEVIERKRSEAALLEYQRELQEVMSRLIDAQEAESKYVARELHDVFSQKLGTIGREIASLERRSPPSAQALGSALRGITGQVHALAGDLHRMSRHIHPAILADLGLSAAIRSECVAFSEQHHMPVDFHADDIPPGIPEAVALCLYRVAQEALRNVGKHAGVSSADVNLRLTTTGLALTVDDTGKGFEVERIAGKRGLGLVSMEERLRMVRGTLTIRSNPGDGTSVRATVPLSR